MVGIGLWFYYKELKIRNREILNEEGPRIIIANHPNTMIDAWLIGYFSKEHVYFLAKGTFFNSRLKRIILKSLKLIPINRSVEEKLESISNKDSFEACYQVLEEGKKLVIFPEGNSLLERRLRQLKTGTARIALEAERRNDGKLGLKVIPVGLIYLRPEKFRSSVLVKVGEGIHPVEYLDDYKDNPTKAARELTAEFRSILEMEVIATDGDDLEKLVEDLYLELQSRYRERKSQGIEAQMQLLQSIRDRVEDLVRENPDKLELIHNRLLSIRWKVDQLNIKSDFLDRRIRIGMMVRQLLLSSLYLIIGFPAFLFGFIHNGIPYKLTDYLMPALVKHIEYYAPVAILLGLVLYPLNYWMFIELSGTYFDFSLLQNFLYFASMPISGLFAYYFFHYIKHISLKYNFIYLAINRRKMLEEIQAQRKQLYEDVFFED